MGGRTISIARIMMIIALAAANCALLREVSWAFLSFPTIWAGMGILDFLILWKLILRRTLRASHYTFLILFVPAFVILTYLASRELIHPAGPFLRLYQRITRDRGGSVSRLGIGEFADIWLAGVLAFLLSWAAGMLAGWLERWRGWDIAAFSRGALVGFGVANVFALLNHAVLGMQPPGSPATYANQAVLSVCMIVGGLVGLARLKSDFPRKDELGSTVGASR